MSRGKANFLSRFSVRKISRGSITATSSSSSNSSNLMVTGFLNFFCAGRMLGSGYIKYDSQPLRARDSFVGRSFAGAIYNLCDRLGAWMAEFLGYAEAYASALP